MLYLSILGFLVLRSPREGIWGGFRVPDSTLFGFQVESQIATAPYACVLSTHRRKSMHVRIAFRLLLLAGLIYGLLFGLAYSTSIHPESIETVSVLCEPGVETLEPGQELKVLSWNVQYMAGKDYVFFYDVPDGSATDSIVSEDAMQRTLDEVARVIIESDADLVLLQEVDEDSKRTGYVDQLAELLERLRPQSFCRAETFYWRARFVPHPKILGSVGMKLVTLSRYRIDSARRFALPQIPGDPLYRQLYFHRAMLETRLPISDGSELVAINTHFDAWGRGSDVMTRQVETAVELARQTDHETEKWIFGGDFNLLPPDFEPSELHPDERSSYAQESEIAPLFEEFRSSPSLVEVTGSDRESFFTSFPNHPEIEAPDKTIDYLFYGLGITVSSFEVRRADTLEISDHLPLVAEIGLQP